MAKTSLVVCGSYHLGDSPGTFQNATYVGHRLALPVRLAWLDERAETVAFHFGTHDVETWAGWNGHRVTVNGTEIGRIKDISDLAGEVETAKIEIRRVDLLKLLGGKDTFTLAVELEKRSGMPHLSDDFVLTRIATSSNLSVALGWK